MERKFRVGISGSYGGYNLGDEGILQSIVAELRRSVSVEITVFTRDAENTLRRHDVERAVPVRDIVWSEAMAEMERLDLFVLGGGGILYDLAAHKYLREVRIAHEIGVPVMVYAVGVGPLKDSNVQAQVREALDEVAVLTVRERGSRKALEEAGVRKEVRVTADPAFLLEAEPFPDGVVWPDGLLSRDHRVVAMSVREPGGAAPDLHEDAYHALVADAADFIVDRFDADVLFVPMEAGQQDVQHSHAVISRMLQAQRATVLKGDYRPGQILSLMEHFDFAVGMRLHFLMFAAMQGVPFVALPYASKVSGLLQNLGIAVPPIQKVNAGRIIAYIDHFWDNRSTLRRDLKESIHKMKKEARETNRLLVELIEKTAAEKQLTRALHLAPTSTPRFQ